MSNEADNNMRRRVINRFGWPIYAICASCQMCAVGKPIDASGEFRSCSLDGGFKMVRPTEVCECWKMADRWRNQNVSMELAKVKCKEYFHFLADFRHREMIDGKLKKLPNEQVRELFEREFNQSVYLDI